MFEIYFVYKYIEQRNTIDFSDSLLYVMLSVKIINESEKIHVMERCSLNIINGLVVSKGFLR